jgi:predicted aconitase with swiveling domain
MSAPLFQRKKGSTVGQTFLSAQFFAKHEAPIALSSRVKQAAMLQNAVLWAAIPLLILAFHQLDERAQLK